MTATGFAVGAYTATQQLTKAGALKGLAAGIQGGAAAAAAPGFGQLVASALDGAAGASRKAEAQAIAAASGKTNLVEVVTAVAESETALQSLVAVRDRVIAAYEEIMRMQV
ncbi:flagellar hook-basal body complex protein FliE [Enterovirga rhinocerotis]|uniref:Flagellar hook-basal body complex protein FliE n=1 Tax=Enterovirga rhinocerotis TaxID=1339210 RepID=A0A4R7BWS1_9HYPH|nr:flagellar hook-basal body complex protein FliE [Enterovirga rhinocerotis]TDR89632.1 flagellar hook-basal body complex protein FliE [Enterovirga rhinocerotis]